MREGREALFRYGPAAFALVPFGFLVWAVCVTAVDVPYLDAWDFIPLLAKSYDGTLGAADLWAQHNEHRLVFPRLIMLALARLTGWDVRWELATSVLLAFGIAVVWARRLEADSGATGARGLRLALPAAAVFIFSLRQSENWLWGWQLQMFLSVFAVTLALHVLGTPPLRWPRLTGAALLGVVATYSFANGMLIWPLGGVLVALAPAGPGARRGHRVLAWLAVAALAAASYLYRYRSNPGHPPLTFAITHPLDLVAYVLAYVGAPLSAATDGAIVAGVLGLAAAAAAVALLLGRRTVSLGLLLPYLALMSYAVGSGAVAGLGRVGMGVDQALSPRYVTVTSMFWSGLAVLLLLAAIMPRGAVSAGGSAATGHSRLRSGGHGHVRHAARRSADAAPRVAAAVLATLVIVAAWASVSDLSSLRRLHDRLEAGRADLLAVQQGLPRRARPITALHPSFVDVELKGARFLAEHRLSLFRESGRVATSSVPTSVAR